MADNGEPTALEQGLAYLRCPVCGRELAASGGEVGCESGHVFDIARQGYVSFLTGHAQASTADSAEMVAARARFLDRGFYSPIADAIVTAAASAVEPTAASLALDIGGGTGYYLARLLDSRPATVGIDLDLSARALRIAARAHPRMAAIAADAWRLLPIADAAAAIILSVFSPRNADETARVLAPGGRVVIVSPTPRHLGELVSTLGLVTVDERKSERLDRAFAAFDLTALKALEYEVVLDADDVRNVVMMGPSARHLDPERLDAVDGGTAVTVSVEVRSYERQRSDASG
jgi:23S rRNA (guanine745-N1)-methyltransferase